MYIILKKKLKFYTKEFFKFSLLTIIAFGFIIAITIIKYKPTYKVNIDGTQIGYIKNIKEFEESVKEQIIQSTDKNIDNITLNIEPEYELKLIARTQENKEEEVVQAFIENTTITYKYYEIALNDTTLETVNTLEEAQELTNKIKQENEGVELSIIEKYTENEDEIVVNQTDIAQIELQDKVTQIIEEEKKKKEEEERINSLPEINGIKIAVVPVTGTVTSRYGESSRLRVSTHTGLDIAAVKGTPIKVVADGTVTFAAYNGSYGYLVKVNHGNGVETWYAHTSKMYVTVGQTVSAGDVIAAVGSTGNSTGPHLHLEIRLNGVTVNPQKYLYK